MIDVYKAIGKCSMCEHDKTLDMMVRDGGMKGSYHCIDCETVISRESDAYTFNHNRKIVDENDKVKRLFRWLLGI